jgi:hypothetical protein
MDIQDAIDTRKKLILRLQEEISALEKAADILRDKNPDEKPRTQADMATAVLDEVGRPMHVLQISGQIKKRFQKTIKPNNLGVMLFRYARRKSRFYKVLDRPNTYGLIRWQSIEERMAEEKAQFLVAAS